MTEATTNPAADDTNQATESTTGVIGEAFDAKPAANEQAAPAAGETAAPAATDDKPVEYAFKAPEGIALGEAEGKAKALASELKLAPDKAQAFIDLAGEIAASHAKAQSEKQMADVRAEVGRWVEIAKKDPEIGGDKLPQTLATANAAMTKFGTPELAALLKSTGLGNHPEVVRVFAKVGSLIAEDKVLGSGADTAPQPARSPAEILFGKAA